MAVRLEVGKAYRTRGGQRVEITSSGLPSKVFPFGGIENGIDRSYRTDGRHCHKDDCDHDLIAEWTDKPEPEIDWGGELQVLCLDGQWAGWNDVTMVWHDDTQAIGWASSDTPEDVSCWPFAEYQFRNKPPDPKRVKGWIRLFKPFNDDIYSQYTPNKPASQLSDFAIIAIDVAEGEGLS